MVPLHINFNLLTEHEYECVFLLLASALLPVIGRMRGKGVVISKVAYVLKYRDKQSQFSICYGYFVMVSMLSSCIILGQIKRFHWCIS